MNASNLPEREHPPRRRFLEMTARCVLCGLVPVARATAAGRTIDVGALPDYPRDVISEKYITHDLFVIRHQGRIIACTAVCPHKANALLLDAQDPTRIICSGHDSKFSPEGLPVRGPARRPLVRYAIALDAAGRLQVDRSREFPRNQWSDPASFVRADPA